MSGKPRILVVEDNAAFCSVIRLNLERVGFEVEVARNGKIALTSIRNCSPFDAVVTDEQMPELSGLELCASLRAIEEYRRVPIILLTAKRLEVDVDHLTEKFNLSAIHAKPFSPTKLVQEIQGLLEPVK